MTVKILAVDMDGTFLNSKKQYNKARFLKQYEQLKQNNIHFVVASGNQLAKLVTYFPEINHEIAFIAEIPPKVSAGKNFKILRLKSKACRISVGVATPGKYGIPSSEATLATEGEKPAETANLAPTSAAAINSFAFFTEPTPTEHLLFLENSRIALILSGVRKVISAIGKPASSKAFARPAALLESLIVITGINLFSLISSIIATSSHHQLSKFHHLYNEQQGQQEILLRRLYLPEHPIVPLESC